MFPTMARLPNDKYTCPWGDADDCPCGSGSAFARCCKSGAGGLPYVKIPSLAPPGEGTGYSHPKCYMAPTKNCSEKITREHYVSEAILKRFDKLNVSGMPWQEKGEVKILPTNSLVGNILCERHNSALSPLDSIGLNAFDALTEACDYALNRRSPGRVQHYLISGDGLELWMFKLCAGIHFGGIAAAEGGILRDTCSFPQEELISALSTATPPPTSGLWVSQLPGLVQRAQIGIGPLIEEGTGRQLGVQVQFGPLQFISLLVTPPATERQFQKYGHLLKPHVIDFIGPDRDARVVLSWPGTPLNRVNRIALALSRDTEGIT
jgi:hypothetical protein